MNWFHFTQTNDKKYIIGYYNILGVLNVLITDYEGKLYHGLAEIEHIGDVHSLLHYHKNISKINPHTNLLKVSIRSGRGYLGFCLNATKWVFVNVKLIRHLTKKNKQQTAAEILVCIKNAV